MPILFGRQTTAIPTEVPTTVPTSIPTAIPTAIPSNLPSSIPSNIASNIPSNIATTTPTATPSANSLTNTANGVKNTFTSWDGCMSKTYCKWPVIATIIIGSLILLSILWCFARCLCCGAECACCCFKCCAGCCGGGKKKGHKHLDSAPNTPYRSEPPPLGWNQQYQSSAPPLYHQQAAAPSFATFDASKPVHADSLPAMPSWENAPSRKVEVIEEPETHEMDKLDPKNSYNIPTSTDRNGPTVPAVTAPTPVRPNGPGSPFSEHDSFLSGGAYGHNNQQGGYADSHNQYASHTDNQGGYRGVSPNSSQFGHSNNQQHYGSGQQQYGGNQQHYDRDDPYNSGPVSPMYAPSGSTAYEPPARHYTGYNQQQGQPSSYGVGQPARKPLNGSWRDI